MSYKNTNKKEYSLADKMLKTLTGFNIPSYEQLERGMIGYLLMYEEAQPIVFSKLKPKHFWVNNCKEVYIRMLKMKAHFIPVSLATVAQELHEAKSNIKPYYLIECQEIGSSALTNQIELSKIIDTIVQLHARREIMRIANKSIYLAGKPLSNIDAPQLLEDVEKSFESVKNDYYSTIDEDLDQYKYDQTEEIPDFSPILLVEHPESGWDLPICEQGAMIGVIGPKGSRKTYTLLDIVACFLGVPSQIGFIVPRHQAFKRILYIDTEQRKRTFMLTQNKVKQRVYDHYGDNEGYDIIKEFLHAYMLACKSVSERLKIVLRLLELIEPEICVLDGVVDLVEDYNSQKESRKFVDLLMRERDKRNIPTTFLYVIHTAKTTGQARGHLGTELDNKTEVMLKTELVEDDPTFTTLSCVKNREAPKFLPFDFEQTRGTRDYLKKENMLE